MKYINSILFMKTRFINLSYNYKNNFTYFLILIDYHIFNIYYIIKHLKNDIKSFSKKSKK